MKNLTIILFITCLFTNATLYASTQKHLTIYFNSGDYHLLPHEKMKLDTMKNATMLILCGHTDADGSAGSNYILSEKRVNEVFVSLQKMGIDQSKMRIDYHGENQPLNTNLTAEEKAMNRRVDIVYSDDPLLALKVATQHYTINNKIDTTFILKEGTKVYIPANAFEGKKVDLSIREFVSNKSILAENLTTKSGLQNLETAGMLYMEARVNNQVVSPTDRISLTFKNTSGKTDFKFFEGEEKKDLSVDWQTKNTIEGISNNEIVTEKDSNDSYYRIFITGTQTYDLNSSLKDYYNKLATTLNNNENLSSIDDSIIKVRIIVDKYGYVTAINDMKKEDWLKDQFLKIVFSSLPVKFPGKCSAYESEMKMNIHFNKMQTLISSTITRINNNAFVGNYYNDYEAHSDLEEIVLKTKQLGWINCDRFYNDNRPKIAYAVKTEEDVNVKLIMKNDRSFYSPHVIEKTPNIKYYANTPIDEPVVLIATVRRGDKILLAIAETKTSKTPFSGFKFEEVSIEELEKRIDQLEI